MTLLLLATPNDQWEERIRHAFEGSLNGDMQRNSSALLIGDNLLAARALIASGAAVVLIGPGPSSESALEIAAHIDRERPGMCVVLVGEPTPDLLQRALRAGVRDVLPENAPIAEVREILERTIYSAVRRREAENASHASAQNRVITVVSPKGGAGKTAISTNLAVGLARNSPNQVVMVDLDLQFGDDATALRLTPDATIVDASRSASMLDATTIKAYLTPHPSGVFVLCAPTSPSEADEVDAKHVGLIVDLLGKMFKHVVIDTGAGLDDIVLTAMEHSTDIVLVCGTDVASARAMRKELDALSILGLTTQRRHFALNRADARVGLSTSDIEATVGMLVDVAIPSSRAFPLSMNQGTPLLDTDQRNTPLSRALGELVHRFEAAAVANTEVPSDTGWLRRRNREATR